MKEIKMLGLQHMKTYQYMSSTHIDPGGRRQAISGVMIQCHRS